VVPRAGRRSRRRIPDRAPRPRPRALLAGGGIAAAERCYASARAHPAATADERCQAHFYELAALGRQQRYAEALELGRAYLAAYPNEAGAPCVLFFQGVYLEKLGRTTEARAAWEAVLARESDTPLAASARAALAGN
jgi:tetratricopeptide (TPR) repeat protein